MSVAIRTKNGTIKRYSTVAERLNEVHQSGAKLEILESIPVQVGEAWIWRVVIEIDSKRYMGYALVNLNSENAAERKDPWATGETSALGRAIGFGGWLSDESIASADEVLRGR